MFFNEGVDFHVPGFRAKRQTQRVGRPKSFSAYVSDRAKSVSVLRVQARRWCISIERNYRSGIRGLAYVISRHLGRRRTMKSFRARCQRRPPKRRTLSSIVRPRRHNGREIVETVTVVTRRGSYNRSVCRVPCIYLCAYPLRPVWIVCGGRVYTDRAGTTYITRRKNEVRRARSVYL